MKTVLEQLRTALSSAYPLIFIVSMEEERIETLLKRFADGARPDPLPLLSWNCVEGFGDKGPGDLTDPVDALTWIQDPGSPRGFYLFKDLGDFLDDRRILRTLRNTAMRVRNTGRFLFILKSDNTLPADLSALSYVILSLFPDASELKKLVNELLEKNADWKDRDTESGEDTLRLISSLRGMSLTEVEHLLRRTLSRHKGFTETFFKEILDEKEQITRKEGILEFVQPDVDIAKLGGLDQLKEWVGERKELFLPKARREGVPTPRGVLLMGISGCGKSLAVKVIAEEWNLPLFRLDMNLVFSGVHGSAEWVFHRSLDAMESVAPAVLWIDEIEMGVAGYHEGETGSLTRIFSTFLTWMQEHKADVFVAATANRISLLPAEILRKGRFDQVFFFDLPNEEERKEILRIHLTKNGLDPGKFDLILLASATRAWNGAEIEQAVIQALITAHAAEEDVTQKGLLTAFSKIIPLSRTMDDQIKAIRSWARTRALPATRPLKRAL